jgi:glycosyltransferase involved in cell wall biosynthesis
MTVVHLSPATFGRAGIYGGGERYPVELARAMSKFTPTRLVSFSDHYSRERVGDLDVVLLPVRHRLYDGSMNPLSERLLPSLWRSEVIHCHQHETVLTDLALMKAAVSRTKVFSTDHGGRSRHLSARFKLADRLDGFLPVSNFSASLFPALADRTKVIYGGVDETRYFPDESVRERKVVFVGRIMPHKGIDVLIRALPTGVPLHIYGRSADPAYLAVLKDFAVGRDVSFHHEASDAEVLAAYRTSMVSVLPSVYETEFGPPAPWSELLGLALIEAMACATPVIASEVGGMPEIIEDGTWGRVVPPGNVDALHEAICSIVDAGAAWQRMSNAAIDAVRSRFTWDLVARSCLSAYSS